MDEIGGDMMAVNKRYVTNNIATIHLTMGEIDLADELYQKCIALLGDPEDDTVANLDLATYYHNLSGVRLLQASAVDADSPEHQEIVAEAVDLIERALSISRRFGDSQSSIINRLLAYSRVLFEAGVEDEALVTIDSALLFAQQENNNYLETSIYLVKGDFAYQQGHNDLAETYFENALEIAKDNQYDKVVSNVQEVKARQGVVIAVVTQGDTVLSKIADHVIEVPETSPALTPLTTVIPLQILSYYIAVMRGCNVDQPRNLAKSVTVE